MVVFLLIKMVLAMSWCKTFRWKNLNQWSQINHSMSPLHLTSVSRGGKGEVATKRKSVYGKINRAYRLPKGQTQSHKYLQYMLSFIYKGLVVGLVYLFYQTELRECSTDHQCPSYLLKERERERFKYSLNWAQISEVNFVRKLQCPDKTVPANEFCLPGLQLNLCSSPYPSTSSSEVA